ncbi:hypothetical protein KEC57_18040 [Microbacterium sp. BWT-G7]|uniref:DUF4190 domain-containing protein n=2 Tax=Microbacterium allomyrinae TaxID=2830666 RepID=A0A9X1S537_9MICO|nr:hypothetical protein [Microbacterium allomyrinae]
MSDDERMPRPAADGEGRLAPVADVPDPRADPATPPVPTMPPVPVAPTTPSAPSPARPETQAPGAAAEPLVEKPSPDVALAQDASPLPGAHRGGFQRLPTAPVAVTTQSAPAEPGTEESLQSEQWLASQAPAMHRGLAGWALAFAVVGLLVSLFVGWGFPIGLVAVVSAIFALRRPLESRAVAVWAIAVGTVSILYSAGWLYFAATRAEMIG